jgi:hypothetical protein
MSRTVEARVADMMRWQSRSLVPVGILLVLAFLRMGARDLLGSSSALQVLFGIAMLCALLAAVLFGMITLWHIFQAGRIAFGVRAGLTYALLAVVLLFWPGLFVIPHMIRLDVKRHFGAEADDGQEGPA